MITAQTPFEPRHIGPSAAEISEMLDEIGFESLDAMTDAIVPTDIRLNKLPDLPEPLPEQDALSRLKKILSANKPVKSLIGQGYYGDIFVR